MKKVLFASVAAVALYGTSALAADLPTKGGYATPAPLFSWTGFYIGTHTGYAFSGSGADFLDDNDPLERISSPNARGMLFGVQAGYNVQVDRVVYGIEGDWSWINRRVTTIFQDSGDPGPDKASVKLKPFGSVRGRLGVTLQPTFLVYGTVGWGWAEGRFALRDSDNTPTDVSFSLKDSGVVYGAGIESMWLPNWTWRAEWLHYTLNKSVTDITTWSGGGGESATIHYRLKDMNVFRFGLNYKFGG